VALHKRLARFNRRVTNRITGPVAKWLPGFGVITHTGRRSKRRYRTPVNVFAAPGGYVVALTYGADSDWVKNVLASGGCELDRRGRTEHLTAPNSSTTRAEVTSHQWSGPSSVFSTSPTS
jgi:deazaflavin-dependent oxidoreductase (nitroreductase family)